MGNGIGKEKRKKGRVNGLMPRAEKKEQSRAEQTADQQAQIANTFLLSLSNSCSARRKGGRQCSALPSPAIDDLAADHSEKSMTLRRVPGK